MSEKEIRDRGKEIQDQLAKHLSNKLDMPVLSIDKDLIDGLYEDVKGLAEIEGKYSSDELYSEVSDFLSTMHVFRPKDRDELLEHLDEFASSLGKEKTYEANLILPSVSDIPVGTRLGNLEIVEQSTPDARFQEFLDYIVEHQNLHVEGRSHAKVVFKAYTTVNATDLLYQHLELPFAILSLVLDFDIDPRDSVGIVKSPDISKGFFLRPHRNFIGWSRLRSPEAEERLRKLSRMSLEVSPSRLEQKVLQAVQIYGLARLSRRPQIRFIFLIASLESLLLSKHDRDYLGKKLAEKAAFLLENEYEKRLDLYKFMKKSYRRRSTLVHEGDLRIEPKDLLTIQHVFRQLAFKLIELSASYEKMEQKSHAEDKEGVEDYIHQLKFS